MSITRAQTPYDFERRIEALRRTKEAQTQEKHRVIGSMDHDDWALILPPEERREMVETISGSGMPIKDVRLTGVTIESNHPSGGFFGPSITGRNFRSLLEAHPTYVDPMSSLAGGYMVNFGSYRDVGWNPDFNYDHLRPDQERYQLLPGIGATQHFCQDLGIGLRKGWQGILDEIRQYRDWRGDTARDFYDGLEHVVVGIQDWIRRTAEDAKLQAQTCSGAQRENLEAMAKINASLVTGAPQTFREACQWILWFQIISRMYNGSGSLGRLDDLLLPFYEKDKAQGLLDDEEASFHIACLLLRDTAYLQVGGVDPQGRDTTNPVSYLILEAVHQLKIPSNLGVSVGEAIDPGLLRRGAEIMVEDRTGIPKFLGHDHCIEEYTKNGHPIELTRQRAYSGCHWYGLPGREYTMMDTVKINLAAVLDVALQDMFENPDQPPGMDRLLPLYETHLQRAVETIAKGLDFHCRHMQDVFPELVMDLLCYGPIEKGMDASYYGVEFYNLCLDGAGLATAADSLAALDQLVETEGRYTWQEIQEQLANNWDGEDGEEIRQRMAGIDRFGSGGSLADGYAEEIVRTFTRLVKEKPTPDGRSMVPGLFSWANTIPMGRQLRATPNGRRDGEPISHGANPDPGFRRDNAATALAAAVAAVQPGFGNAAPLQIELDPSQVSDDDSVDRIVDLINAHFSLGGTQINMNVVDKEKVLEAHADPAKHLDLVVRVTGFSAYFASLSPEFRQLVVDRIVGLK